MALPFCYSGHIEVQGRHDPKAALRKIEHGLDRLKARRAVLVGQQIQFSAGVLRSFVARGALGAAGSGEVSVQVSTIGLTITYRVRFTLLFWVSLFMVGFISLGVLGASNLSQPEAAAILFGLWLWLYGGNVAVTLFRFPRWLRTTIGPS